MCLVVCGMICQLFLSCVVRYDVSCLCHVLYSIICQLCVSCTVRYDMSVVCVMYCTV